MRIVRMRLLFAMVILLGMTRVISAGAQESYYNGNSIRLIVGLALGGGYDLYSKIIARHMGKHIPGNPAIEFDGRKFEYIGVPAQDFFYLPGIRN